MPPILSSLITTPTPPAIRRRHAAAVSIPNPHRFSSASSSTSTSSLLRLHNISYPPATCTRASHLPRFSLSGSEPFLQDTAATAAVLAGANALVFAFDSLTQKNLIQQSLSRKLVHILSGLLFAACWPLFRNKTTENYKNSFQYSTPISVKIELGKYNCFKDSTSPHARYFASFVPLVNCLRLLIHGFSLATDQGLIKSVTREGNPQELLRGPLYYVLILILCAVVFWRDSPIGIIALAMMCGGDGVADIVGRRFGSIKLPYNQQKSWAGTIAMFGCGFLISIGMLYYYSALGYFELDWLWTIQRVALIALVATMVESFSTTLVLDDNISVPLASIVAAYLSFGF